MIGSKCHCGGYFHAIGVAFLAVIVSGCKGEEHTNRPSQSVGKSLGYLRELTTDEARLRVESQDPGKWLSGFVRLEVLAREGKISFDELSTRLLSKTHSSPAMSPELQVRIYASYCGLRGLLPKRYDVLVIAATNPQSSQLDGAKAKSIIASIAAEENPQVRYHAAIVMVKSNPEDGPLRKWISLQVDRLSRASTLQRERAFWEFVSTLLKRQET